MEIRVETQSIGASPRDSDDPGFGESFGDHMLLAEYRQGGWQDAVIRSLEPLSLSPATTVLHYGQSVFEGMRAQRDSAGAIWLFRLQDHYRRMNRSTARMCMPAIPNGLFADGIRQLVGIDQAWVSRRPDRALYIRPVCFSTEEALGVRVSNSYRFAVVTSPMSSYHRSSLGLWLSRDNVRSHAHGTGDVKVAGNYGASLRATQLAKQRGFDEVVWVDAQSHSHIEECGTMNLFFVIDDTVVTPALNGTILPGITRDTVLSILDRWRIPTSEREITVDELLDCHTSGRLTECFGTGTAAGIVPVDRIGYEDACTVRLEGKDPSIAGRLSAALIDARCGRIHPSWVEAI